MKRIINSKPLRITLFGLELLAISPLLPVIGLMWLCKLAGNEVDATPATTTAKPKVVHPPSTFEFAQ